MENSDREVQKDELVSLLQQLLYLKDNKGAEKKKDRQLI